MRFPQWLKTALVTATLATLGWAMTDRMNIGERISTLEGFLKQNVAALERIESKLDALLKEKK